MEAGGLVRRKLQCSREERTLVLDLTIVMEAVESGCF